MTVRVLTFNTGAGNPRVRTPQERFLELPFYREALTGAPGAPILALQEVGDAQARALREAAGTATVLQRRRPGLGNALVVPARYEVQQRRARFFVRPQVAGIATAARVWRRTRARTDWRQFGELRIWIEARLRDLETGRRFTVLNTHLSVEPSLKLRQGAFVVARAVAAAADGPVIVAGDMNVPAGAAKGRDVPVAEQLGRLRDMVEARARKNIDYVLALGFEPVASRIWAADELAGLVSDHDPREATLAYSG